MPTTAGNQLTEQHRQQQIRLAAGTSRQLMQLWPIWDGTRQTFDMFTAATVMLTQGRRRDSAGLAAGYYRAYRVAEGLTGDAPIRLADRVEPERVITSLNVVARRSVQKSIQSGLPPQAARQIALGRTQGAVTRHVMNGGRETILQTLNADPAGQRWQRVTSGRSCDFCQMLAGRGAVYRPDTADFQAHDNCSCTAQPVF